MKARRSLADVYAPLIAVCVALALPNAGVLATVLLVIGVSFAAWVVLKTAGV